MKKTIISPSPIAPCRFECTPAPSVFPRTVTPCRNNARENGWCEHHEYAARLLERARSYGCPRLEIVTTYTRYDMATHKEVNEQFVWEIGRGVDAWIAVCERVTPEHARKIEAVLEWECSGLFGKKSKVA